MVEHEFIALKCLAQLILQRHLAGHGSSFGLLVIKDAFGLCLGFFQCRFCILEQFVGAVAIVREERHADLEGNPKKRIV